MGNNVIFASQNLENIFNFLAEDFKVMKRSRNIDLTNFILVYDQDLSGFISYKIKVFDTEEHKWVELDPDYRIQIGKEDNYIRY